MGWGGALTPEIHNKHTTDPKAPLPQAVLNFCTKKIAGMLIHFVKQQVRVCAYVRVRALVAACLPFVSYSIDPPSPVSTPPTNKHNTGPANERRPRARPAGDAGAAAAAFLRAVPPPAHPAVLRGERWVFVV